MATKYYKEMSTSLYQETNKVGRYSQACLVSDFIVREVDWSLMVNNIEAVDLMVIQDIFC